MRRRLGVGFLVFALLALFMVPSGALAQSKMHLKFSTWHPPASREVKTVWTPMLEELKKKSNGRITYTLYAGAALGKGPEHYDIVAKGLSDMGYFTATWTPGRFPLTDVLSMAAWVEGKDVAVNIGNKMYKEALSKEFPGVKMIEMNGCIQAFLWTRKPVKGVEDCKGLKIRSPGGLQTSYIKSLGAEPVFMPLGDVYLALETGTIDGLVTCPPLVLAFKLQEVVKYGVVATFGCVSEGVIMNQKSWDNTPKDLKPIIESVCSNPFKTTGGLNRDVYKVMMNEITGKGVQLYKPTSDQEKRWFAGFQQVTRDWVKGLEAKGLPAKEVVMKYDKIARQEGVVSPAVPEEWRK
jgi:TRAP-type C4-dicarboxylate transport system substrate-binding protein